MNAIGRVIAARREAERIAVARHPQVHQVHVSAFAHCVLPSAPHPFCAAGKHGVKRPHPDAAPSRDRPAARPPRGRCASLRRRARAPQPATPLDTKTSESRRCRRRGSIQVEVASTGFDLRGNIDRPRAIARMIDDHRAWKRRRQATRYCRARVDASDADAGAITDDQKAARRSGSACENGAVSTRRCLAYNSRNICKAAQQSHPAPRP